MAVMACRCGPTLAQEKGATAAAKLASESRAPLKMLTYGYAMYFMNQKALEQLDKANGFEAGVGPSIVVVDEGMGTSRTTNTLSDDVYAFIFGQKGLMAGLGIQGNKITKITPK